MMLLLKREGIDFSLKFLKWFKGLEKYFTACSTLPHCMAYWAPRGTALGFSTGCFLLLIKTYHYYEIGKYKCKCISKCIK